MGGVLGGDIVWLLVMTYANRVPRPGFLWLSPPLVSYMCICLLLLLLLVLCVPGGRNRKFMRDPAPLEYRDNPEHGMRLILTFK